MRQERTVQASIFDLFAGHEIGCELKAMSQWLDGHRELLGLVARDLRRDGVKADRTARPAGGGGAALCAAQAVPPAELRGAGVPSRGLRLVPRLCPPAVGVVPEEVGAAQDDQRDPAPRPGSRSIGRCWRAPGRRRSKTARSVRLDSTVTAALMHEPSDSSLLWDAVRVMVRLLRQADALAGRRRRMARSSPRGQEARPGDPVHAAADPSGSSSTAS